jgi:hypothetical protein
LESLSADLEGFLPWKPSGKFCTAADMINLALICADALLRGRGGFGPQWIPLISVIPPTALAIES